ncbi:MAG: hypothetical protein WCO09_03255 [bacterium]
MQKPTLLFVEEFENILSNRVLAKTNINVVLLRLKQNMLFSEDHMNKTSNVPCFILDKKEPIDDEVKRFNNFCYENKIKIDYFYNDSEYNQETVQKFASLLKLPGSLNKDQALCVRDKAVMKDKLKEIGYLTMDYKELSSLQDAVDFSEEHGGFPVIVKWRRGLSSKEVYKIEDIRQLEELNLDYSTGRFIIEVYSPYLIWCVDSLVQDGKVIATFLTWLPYTNLSFTEKKEKFAQITVDKYPDEITFDGSKIVQDIVNSLSLKNGYLHLEVFVKPYDKPTICEFAWRTSGEHMLLNHSIAFNLDVYALMIDIMVGRKIEPIELKGVTCVGDMFLPITEGVVTKITPYNELKDLEGVIGGEINYKVGDVIQTKRQYTNCSGWLQIKGRTKEEVLSRMLKAYEKFVITTKTD